MGEISKTHGRKAQGEHGLPFNFQSFDIEKSYIWSEIDFSSFNLQKPWEKFLNSWEKFLDSCSVGRCVIPWEFLGKSVKHTCSCRKMYPI